MVVLGKTNLSEWANMRDEASASGWSAYGGLTRNPYGAEPLRRRLQLRQRRRGGGRPGAVRRRHRDRRLDQLPGGVQRVRRDQADRRHGPHRRAWCRSRRPRTPPARWPRPSPTPPRCSPCWPPTAPTTRRTPSPAGWPASGSGCRGRPTGATPRTRTPRPSGRWRCWPPRARRSSTAPTCRRSGDEVWEDELLVLLAEFRAGIEDYLATRTGDVPRTLREVVDFNREHAGTELAHFGQDLLEKALDGPARRRSRAPRGARARDRGHPRRRHRPRAARARRWTRWSPRRTPRPTRSTWSTPSPSRAPAPARPRSRATRSSRSRPSSRPACRWPCRSGAPPAARPGSSRSRTATSWPGTPRPGRSPRRRSRRSSRATRPGGPPRPSGRL